MGVIVKRLGLEDRVELSLLDWSRVKFRGLSLHHVDYHESRLASLLPSAISSALHHR